MAKENRAAARLAAVQALYQMDISHKGLSETCDEFERHWIGGEIEGHRYVAAELGLFRDIVAGVLADQADLDNRVDRTLQQGWPLRRIEAVMRAVMRAGAYELKKHAQTPARVVIKEYVDVAAAFLAKEEVGMTNAVLDNLARQFRPAEFEQRAS